LIDNSIKIISGNGFLKPSLLDFSINKLIYFSFILILIQLISSTPVFSWDRPFNNASNWGGTGLMEIPTARVLDDGVMRIGVAQALPFRWYSGGMGVFPGLEFSGRLTEMTNVPTRLGPDYGAYKDKAFDVKYQIIPESKLLPAIAIGLHDFHGTRLFPAEYIVLSRQIFPLDITLGFGSKRLQGPVSLPFMDNYGLFGGIEFAINERVHLLAEYNPIEYEKDKKRAVPEGAKSPINIGLRAKILPGLDFGLSYQRGDVLGLMLHMQFLLGKPLLPKRPDPPMQTSVDRRPFHERDPQKMMTKIHEAIHEAGFSEVSVYTNGKELISEFENGRYFSNQKAVGRVLRILLFHAPYETEKLIVVLKRRDMPLLKVSVKPDHLEKYLFGKIPEKIFSSKLVDIKVTKQIVDPLKESYIQTQEDRKLRFDFNIKPDFSMHLNDPSGFFKFRMGIKPSITSNIWKGALVHARCDIPFYSNIWSSNITPPDAVRSDSWRYRVRNYSFERLMIDQAFRISERTFGRLSLGYFEKMYAGIGGEILTFLSGGNLAVGIETDRVRKREPRTQFDLLDFERYTILGNAYYGLTGLGMTLHAQYGQFLAGDIGWMFEISRQYDSGVTIGIWYSVTDTDHLTGFNRGYHHKGVYLNLPAKLFLPHDSREMYHYAISPWTRDVAVKVRHWRNLFSLGKDLMPAIFKPNLDKIKE